MSDLEKAAAKEALRFFLDKALPEILAAEEARIPAPYGAFASAVLNQFLPALEAKADAWVEAKFAPAPPPAA